METASMGTDLSGLLHVFVDAVEHWPGGNSVRKRTGISDIPEIAAVFSWIDIAKETGKCIILKNKAVLIKIK